MVTGTWSSVGLRVVHWPARNKQSMFMTDLNDVVYVTFSRVDNDGTRLVATRGYNGPIIARLQWNRRLSRSEEIELNTAVRLGARHD